MTTPHAPADRAELVEVMARHGWQAIQWHKLSDDERERARDVARISLAALEARGVRLVPAEATEEMETAMAAFGVMYWRWSEMCAASPYAPEGE